MGGDAGVKVRLKDSYTKRKYYYISLYLIMIIFVFFIFRSFQAEEHERVATSIKTLLLNEYKQANSMLVSRSLADLENAGILKCVTLTQLNMNEKVFYTTANNEKCKKNYFFEKNIIQKFNSLNGLTYNLNFKKPLQYTLILFEFAVYSIATLVMFFGLYIQKMNYLIGEIQLKMATQVAHDIQSPLAALEMVMDDIRGLPEDSRELTLNAINRIQMIANSFSNTSKLKTEMNGNCLISNVIQMSVNEKCLEFQSMVNINITFSDLTDHMKFIGISDTEMSRVVSNLINNSIHALDRKGEVEITLSQTLDRIILHFKDSGNGFPKKLLNRAIERGNTIGKKGGQGLGLHHAFETITNAGGEFEIFNQDGAVIKMTIPLVDMPDWFCASINFSAYSRIIVVDDDKSIHDLWNRIFKDKNILTDVIHLQNSYEIENGIKDIRENDLVLIDFDLRYEKNGMEIIIEQQLNNAILVSSGYEQKSVQEFCIAQHVKLLPKYLIGKI